MLCIDINLSSYVLVTSSCLLKAGCAGLERGELVAQIHEEKLPKQRHSVNLPKKQYCQLVVVVDQSRRMRE